MKLTQPISLKNGRARLLDRSQLGESALWKTAFANRCKDHRYYELADETIGGNFAHYYLLIEDSHGHERAIQPCFFMHQDMVTASALQKIVTPLRRIFPRLFMMKMLMLGCSAGTGNLAISEADEIAKNETDEIAISEDLREALAAFAQRSGSWLAMLKDFPTQYRGRLVAFEKNGYARLPSMPMTRLRLDFANFEEYMQTRLSKVMRKNLRRKFKKIVASPLAMEVHTDLTPFIDEVYPLYLAVHERSALKFETLTKDFLCRIGHEMSDRTRFFIWRLDGRAVALSICLVHDGAIYDEYLGLDYDVALDLHLYFVTIRDVLEWAVSQGLDWYYSSPLNYDPKLHLGFDLEPLDIYIAYAHPLLRPVFQWKIFRPLIEPTRSDSAIAKFPNAQEIYA